MQGQQLTHFLASWADAEQRADGWLQMVDDAKQDRWRKKA